MPVKSIPARRADAVIQFSVFTPNRLGRLRDLVNLLDSRDVHVLGMTVLTFEGGAHAAMLGDFAVLDFDNDDDPSVAYLETQVGARYLEHPAQINEYRRVYELIYKQAVPLKEYLR